MRTIERSPDFRRDYKRLKRSPRHREELDSLAAVVVSRLMVDQNLPTAFRDHALSGNWAGYRECHLKPDLLVIYRKPDGDTLRLVRPGVPQ